jgi:hypothetical protein
MNKNKWIQMEIAYLIFGSLANKISNYFLILKIFRWPNQNRKVEALD